MTGELPLPGSWVTLKGVRVAPALQCGAPHGRIRAHDDPYEEVRCRVSEYIDDEVVLYNVPDGYSEIDEHRRVTGVRQLKLWAFAEALLEVR